MKKRRRIMDKIASFFSSKRYAKHSLLELSGDGACGMSIDTLIALAPLIFWSAYVFSPSSLLRILVCVLACTAAEALMSFAFYGDVFSLLDLSSVVDGVLCASYLSPKCELWLCVLISLTCSVLFKFVFGVIFRSPIHPVAASVALFAILPAFSSAFSYVLPFTGEVGSSVSTMISEQNTHTLYWYDELFGNVASPIGCASALLVIAGGIYLAARKIIDIKTPIAYIAGACICVYFLTKNANPFEDVSYTLLCGEMLFTAFFILPSRMYAPNSKDIAPIYGVLCGAASMVFCFYLSPTAAFPLSVVVGNIFARVCDVFVKDPRPFGKA